MQGGERLQDAGAQADDALTLAGDDEPDPRATALVREAWAKYGDDVERRLADLEAGQHPYQRAR